MVPNGTRPLDEDELLGPSVYKTFGVSARGSTSPSVSIGGLCLLYSGDINLIGQGINPETREIMTCTNDVIEWMDSDLPRIDQIIDCIGPSNTEEACVVFEDSLFSDLLSGILKLPASDRAKVQDSLLRLGERSTAIINSWLSMCNKKATNITPVYTSEVGSELQKAVEYFSTKISEPAFRNRTKSPVSLMYTYLWPQILKNRGYIKDGGVVCVEPFEHFLELFDDVKRYCTTPGLKRFLQKNPWGSEGENSGFVAAGFIPMLKSSVSQARSKFSRYCPCSDVATQSDPKLKRMKSYVDNPFPLYGNDIFRSAVDLTFYDAESRRVIEDLLTMENDYRREKDMMKDSVNPDRKALLASLKEAYRIRASDGLNFLYEKVSSVYNKLGFVGAT